MRKIYLQLQQNLTIENKYEIVLGIEKTLIKWEAGLIPDFIAKKNRTDRPTELRWFPLIERKQS